MRDADALAWDVAPKAAAALQRACAGRVVRRDRFNGPRVVGGVDASFPDGGDTTRAAAVAMSFPDLEVLDECVAELPTRFPYVPGMLSFREVPAIAEALAGLAVLPDVILCDGHGVARIEQKCRANGLDAKGGDGRGAEAGVDQV